MIEFSYNELSTLWDASLEISKREWINRIIKLQAARATADRATALEESAAICQRLAAEALDSYTTEAGRTAAHGALICAMGEIRNLKTGSAGAEQSKDKYVAIVRVTNEGYAMELSKYIAYALPEGTHELYATPQALQSRDSVIEECARICETLYYQPSRESLLSAAGRIRALKSQQDAAIEAQRSEGKSS